MHISLNNPSTETVIQIECKTFAFTVNAEVMLRYFAPSSETLLSLLLIILQERHKKVYFLLVQIGRKCAFFFFVWLVSNSDHKI
jgi:hypothetical protein